MDFPFSFLVGIDGEQRPRRKTTATVLMDGKNAAVHRRGVPISSTSLVIWWSSELRKAEVITSLYSGRVIRLA